MFETWCYSLDFYNKLIGEKYENIPRYNYDTDDCVSDCDTEEYISDDDYELSECPGCGLTYEINDLWDGYVCSRYCDRIMDGMVSSH